MVTPTLGTHFQPFPCMPILTSKFDEFIDIILFQFIFTTLVPKTKSEIPQVPWKLTWKDNPPSQPKHVDFEIKSKSHKELVLWLATCWRYMVADYLAVWSTVEVYKTLTPCGSNADCQTAAMAFLLEHSSLELLLSHFWFYCPLLTLHGLDSIGTAWGSNESLHFLFYLSPSSMS